MSQIIIQKDNIFFELNQNDFTAEIIYSPNARGHIFLPASINHQSNEYKIVKIKEGSFKSNRKIKSITFSDDSNIQSISRNSFSFSDIKCINITSSVEELEDGWCNNTMKLKKVTISENRNFKFLDDEHQIIVGKSDKSTDNFDTIYFACRSIERAIIPPQIKYIKPYAFEYCYDLQKIEFTENSELLSIGRKSFDYPQIRSIFIPPNVKYLEEGWCKNSQKLETVIISPKNANFKYLDEEPQIIVGKSDKNSDVFDTIYFASRDIEQAVIPKSIKYIRPHSFEYCQKLTTIEFSEDSEIISIGKNAFCNTHIRSFHIPKSLVRLEDGWCSNAYQLKTVTISPENVNFKYLDEEHKIIVGKSDRNSDVFDTICFANRDIEQAIIPKSIKYISSHSFEYCQKLTTIEFSKDSELISIGQKAFYASSLEEITIPKKVNRIHKYTFVFCSNLRQVAFEEGSELVSLEQKLFENCSNLRTIEIPENSSLKKLSSSLFNNTRVESIFIPSSVEELDDDWCCDAENLISVRISPHNPTIKYLGPQNQLIVGKSNKNDDVFDMIYFANRKIDKATIPASIKYIKPHSFENCKSLKKIEISDDSMLESIGEQAFASCHIKSIYFPPNLEYLDEDWCDDAERLMTVKISPKNRNFKYLGQKHQFVVGKSDKNKDDFDTIVFAKRTIKRAKIPQSIKYIKSHAFRYCFDLVLIDFPNSKLEVIGKYAFSDTSIKKITVPKSVYKISRGAFDSCDDLAAVEFEEGSKLCSLNNMLFNFCNKLKTFKMPDNSALKKIGYGIFSFSGIESFHIPANLEHVDRNWLDFIHLLKTVTVSPKNKSFKYLDEKHQIIIGKSDKFSDNFDTICFADRSIENAVIPNSIKYIQKNSFENCHHLKTVNILEGSKMKELPQNSFSESRIESIQIPSNIVEFKDGWCNETPKLRNIIISPHNSNFRYLDKEHQIVVGKSAKHSDVFDTIYVASRGIKHVTIPDSIKYIKPSAFAGCKKLTKVEIGDDSQLTSIGIFAFSSSSIVCFRFPKNIYIYDTNFLIHCKCLKNLEIIGNTFVNERGGIFGKFKNLNLVSFPNIQKLKTYRSDFAGFEPQNFVLFVKANADVTIINNQDYINGDSDISISDDDDDDDEEKEEEEEEEEENDDIN